MKPSTLKTSSSVSSLGFGFFSCVLSELADIVAKLKTTNIIKTSRIIFTSFNIERFLPFFKMNLMRVPPTRESSSMQVIETIHVRHKLEIRL